MRLLAFILLCNVKLLLLLPGGLPWMVKQSAQLYDGLKHCGAFNDHLPVLLTRLTSISNRQALCEAKNARSVLCVGSQLMRCVSSTFTRLTWSKALGCRHRLSTLCLGPHIPHSILDIQERLYTFMLLPHSPKTLRKQLRLSQSPTKRKSFILKAALSSHQEQT